MSVEKIPVVKSRIKRLTVDSVTNWQLPVLVIIFVSVIFVSVKTVVHRHQARVSYMELQKLEKERDKFAAQWSRLKLEQGTALNQVRVEQYARWDLDMKIPKTSEIKMLREPVSRTVEVGLDRQKKTAVSSKVALGE